MYVINLNLTSFASNKREFVNSNVYVDVTLIVAGVNETDPVSVPACTAGIHVSDAIIIKANASHETLFLNLVCHVGEM